VPDEPDVTALVAAAAPVTTGPARAFTASARRIDITTREGRKLIKKPEQWYEDAWAYYDAVPEAKFYGRFMGNSLSRIRPFAGVIMDPDEAPIPIGDAAEVEGSDITADLAAQAEAELGRLTNPDEGVEGIMREFGTNLSIPGDCYLVGRDDPDDGEERWDVYSTSAITVRGDNVLIKEDPGDKGLALPGAAKAWRVWRRHSRWPGWADSNMRAELDTCEELLILARRFRAISKSSTNAGFAIVPNEFDFVNRVRAGGPEPASADGSPQAEQIDGWTQFEQDFMAHQVTPVEDDGSPSAIAMMLMRGPAEASKAIRFLFPDRPIDSLLLQRLDQLIRRFGHGVDVPVEIITGMADANHWTGWLIDDSTYKAAVEPTASIAAMGIGNAILRPALVEAGFDRLLLRRVVVGLDASRLVVRPNRGQDARDAYEAGVLSAVAYLRYLGFPETDLADVAERLQRYALERGVGGVKLTGALMEQSGLVPAGSLPELTEGGGAGAGGGSGDEGAGEDGGDPVPAEPQRALLAAAGVSGEDLGARLAAIESSIRQRLQVAASDAVSDALRRAGNRLRTAAQSNPEMRQLTQGVDPERVGIVLGLASASSIADVDELLDGAFDGLHGRWDEWVGGAQDEIARLLTDEASVSVDPAGASEAVAAYRGRADRDRDAGWAVLAAALLALAREQLFDAAADGRVEGEWDPTVRVQAGTIRDALAVVGGTAVTLTPTGSVQNAGPAGMTSGPLLRAALLGLGLMVAAYRWTTGFPRDPFEPHQRLAGIVFTDWQDERLVNSEAFPATGFFQPGDHRGCQCDTVPAISPLTAAALVVPVAAA
jgi:hypothetical protein